MDKAISLALTNFSHVSPILDFIGVALAGYLQYLLVGVLLYASFKLRYVNRTVVLLAFISAIFSRFVLTTAIRMFYDRPRPFVAMQIDPLISVDIGKYFDSFPSGHAAFFFAFAMAVYFYNKRLGTWLFAGAAVMGLARVFVGVHWSSDIIGGALVGMLGAWIIRKFWPQISRGLRLAKYESRTK
ncbi:MAG: phosphatase PAP2 family protein [Candidatus Yanofskybacteria bacterium]|nr:phosphatase PAP2 family protein [Candidatus Yanofskybacteria bacterium]